jgi:hypothetical protein
MIKVTGFNFTPIHKFRPEKQTFKNDTLGTDSTRLLNTGTQRYVDQLRPESTYYDKEVQEAYTSNLEIIKKREAEERNAAAVARLSPNQNPPPNTNSSSPPNFMQGTSISNQSPSVSGVLVQNN